MKNLLQLGFAAAAAAGLFVNTASASLFGSSYNLGDLIANNEEVTFGDKTFADWSWTVTAGSGPAASDITVTPGVKSDGVTHFLDFAGHIYALPGSVLDIDLTYSVATVPGQRIDAIGQAFTLTALGGSGSIFIVEDAHAMDFTGPVVAHSTVGFTPTSHDASDPDPEAGDQLSINPALSKLWITKDITLQSETDGFMAATMIHQSFHQASVPDGGSTLLLLGTALGFLSLLGKRRKGTPGDRPAA